MASREQVTTALLTEHLRYTPLTLLDDIINTVNELVYQAVNNIEIALLSVPPGHLGFVAPSAASATAQSAEDAEEALEAAARTEIESGIVKLESLLNATVDKDFDKLEIYTLRNLLTVSNAMDDEGLEDWIILEHYKNLQLAKSQSHSQDSPTPESIRHLDSKLSETEKLHSILLAEKARNEAMLSQLRPLQAGAPPNALKQEDAQAGAGVQEPSASFSFLTSTPSAQALGLTKTGRPGVMPQNTSFTYSQLSALKDIMQQLRPHLQKLRDGGYGELTTDRREEDRVAYIESQAKRATERAGVESRTSMIDESGRKVGREEVMALESIVGALGGDRASSAKRTKVQDEDLMEH